LIEALRDLIALQGIDNQISQINIKKVKLPEEIERLENEFAALREGVAEAQARLEETVKRHKELEDQLKKAGEALKRAREKLLEVKTNKEYQASLAEIETMEKKNEGYEEAIIVILEEIDAQKKELKEREEELKREEGRYESRKRQLLTALDAIGQELATCMEEHERIKAHIPPEILKKYEAIKAINHGLAVVPAWKEVCSGCHMNIPPQLYNELYEGDRLIYCPECNRILYWYDQSKDNA